IAARFEEMGKFLAPSGKDKGPKPGAAPLVQQAEQLARDVRKGIDAAEMAELLKASPPADHEGKWRIFHSLPPDHPVANMPNIQDSDRQNAYHWFVRSPDGTYYRIPLVDERDRLPRCYAFLPAEKGKAGKPDRPVRLAVGHLWGISVFDLTPKGPVL